MVELSSNKRILIVVPNDNLGGAEQFLKMVAEYYSNEGYFIDVFFLKASISGAWNYLESRTFKLHFTTAVKEKVGIIHTFKQLLANSHVNYDIAFTSHVHTNSYVSLLRSLNVIKTKFHVARESTCIFDRYKKLKLFIFKLHYLLNYQKIDLVICQTEYMQEQLKLGLRHATKKMNIVTIPNPINLQSVPNSKLENRDSSTPFIVSAGRLIPEKGFDILIEAFAKLLRDGKKMELYILGEGNMRNALVKQIKELGIEDYVFLPGFQKNVYPFFSTAAMCVVSSRIEGFPNVLLQMMSQNSRVVSTKCAGGIDEIKGIYIAETNSSDSLYVAMKSCLESNPEGVELLFRKELEKRSIQNFISKVTTLLASSV